MLIATLLVCTAVLAVTIKKGFLRMSQASDRVNASLAGLSTSVEQLIAKPVPVPVPDEAALNAAADQIDALKAKVDAAVSA